MSKKIHRCQFEGCKEKVRPISNGRFKDKYCNFHRNKVTIERFLCRVYSNMSDRTKGKGTNRPDLYIGKAIVTREVFYMWSRNHPEFLRLYKTWVNCGFDRRFTPSVNRLTSKRGYTIDNMEWVTNSQNCRLATAVRDLNYKKEIYRLIGINK